MDFVELLVHYKFVIFILVFVSYFVMFYYITQPYEEIYLFKRFVWPTSLAQMTFGGMEKIQQDLTKRI